MTKAPKRRPVPIAEALPPAIPVKPSNEITNCLPGTQLHLEDGRKLAFGESAIVSVEEAAFLRERGQAE